MPQSARKTGSASRPDPLLEFPSEDDLDPVGALARRLREPAGPVPLVRPEAPAESPDPAPADATASPARPARTVVSAPREAVEPPAVREDSGRTEPVESGATADEERPKRRHVTLAAIVGLVAASVALAALWLGGAFGSNTPPPPSAVPAGAVTDGAPGDVTESGAQIASMISGPDDPAPAPPPEPPATLRASADRPATPPPTRPATSSPGRSAAPTTGPPATPPLTAPAGMGTVEFNVPIGLVVSRDGVVVGTTADALRLPAGTHRLELSSEALEYSTAVDVRVAEGGTSRATVTLPQGRLALTSTPAATVFVDGRAVGTTPVPDLRLPIGSHEVVWRHPTLGERRQLVMVSARTPGALSVDFGAAPAGSAGRTAPVTPSPPNYADRIFTLEDAGVVAPVEIQRKLPTWTPDASVPRGLYQGILEVVIGPDGFVRSARMRRSVHPSYDGIAVEATSAWRFEPASFNGVPVSFRKSFEVIVHTRRTGGF